jgi:monoterpene epsilon-lactone hydrolase
MAGPVLSGTMRHRWLNLMLLFNSTIRVSLRRIMRGPLLPGWNWSIDVSTDFLRSQGETVFKFEDINEGREFYNALSFPSKAVQDVTIEPVKAPVRGHWYRPKAPIPNSLMLYLHGGGYSYYVKAHHNLIAILTQIAGRDTFALDYRLIPEYPYPAQLKDALQAYSWLIDLGYLPNNMLVAGDSAGGNLALALLLTLRERGLPQPALCVCLSPWTDVCNSGASMENNARYDWPIKHIAEQWSDWYCGDADPRDPLISPLYADLHGLTPIYIQAGGAEILYDMIQAFADNAQEQGADVTLEVWENMNHDFQAYGEALPQAQQALERLRQVISNHIDSNV